MKVSSFDALSQNEGKVQLYEVYRGGSKICCKGYIVAGYSYIPFILSFLLTNGGCLLAYMRLHFNHLWFFVTLTLQLLQATFMLLTTFTDPGIILSQFNNQSNRYEEQYLIPLEAQVIPTKQQFIISNCNQAIKYRHCDSCNIYKPPRTAHCNKCDNCVQDFDHHCKWLGTCIGRRNYRLFFCYILFLSMLLVSLFQQICMNLTKRNERSKELIFYSLLDGGFMIFVTCLLSYHIYLLCSNFTTYEFVKIESYQMVEIEEIMYGSRGCGRKFKWLCQVLFERVLHPVRRSFVEFTDFVYSDIPCHIRRVMYSGKAKVHTIQNLPKINSQQIIVDDDLQSNHNSHILSSFKSQEIVKKFNNPVVSPERIDQDKLTSSIQLESTKKLIETLQEREEMKQSIIQEEQSVLENGSKFYQAENINTNQREMAEQEISVQQSEQNDCKSQTTPAGNTQFVSIQPPTKRSLAELKPLRSLKRIEQ